MSWVKTRKNENILIRNLIPKETITIYPEFDFLCGHTVPAIVYDLLI